MKPEIFWKNYSVNENTGCWEWTKSLDKHGYGKYSHGANSKAHRVAYKLTYPDINIDGWLILHSCDNPKCINPKHLRPGNHKDNAKDMIERGRGRGKRKGPPIKLSGKRLIQVRTQCIGRKQSEETKEKIRQIRLEYWRKKRALF